MDIKVTKGETARLAHIDAFPSEGSELPIPEPNTYVNIVHADLTTWHRCLSHLHTDAIKLMVDKHMVTRMNLDGDEPPSAPCEPCIKVKQTQKPIHKTTDTRADSILGHVFSDVCRKMSTRSYQGFKYFVTWIDDNLCKAFVHGLRHKSDVEQALKAFVSRAEVKTGMPVQALRSDGGGEYTAGSVQSYLSAKGIKHEITTPDTPQHNGVAKRMNRTLLDKVRAMLLDANPDPDPPETTPTPSRPKRTIHAPTHDDDDRYTVTSYGPQKQADEHAGVAQSDIASNPKTYAEAMSRPDAAQWEMACTDEMRTFENMGVY
jgi:hypothetical protein